MKKKYDEELIISGVVVVLSLIVLILLRIKLSTMDETETQGTSNEIITTTFSETTTQPTTTETRTKTTEVTEVQTEDMITQLIKEEIPPEIRCEWGNFTLTQDELELLYTTVFCEAGKEPFECQYMAALVILNRVVSTKYADDLPGVIYERNSKDYPQFSVIDWKDFENRGWTIQVEDAVNMALKENNHPTDMYYFRAGHYHEWAVDYKKVGNTYFSTAR